MKRFLKVGLGLLSLAMGAAILFWCAYSFIVPNEHFQFRLIDLPRLLFPLVLIWVGWSWLRGDSTPAKPYASELTVTLKLSDEEFGTESERQAIQALKRRLEDTLRDGDMAEIDGEEFGGGECSLFIQTDHPTKAKKAIRNFFLAHEPPQSYKLTESEM